MIPPDPSLLEFVSYELHNRGLEIKESNFQSKKIFYIIVVT